MIRNLFLGEKKKEPDDNTLQVVSYVEWAAGIFSSYVPLYFLDRSIFAERPGTGLYGQCGNHLWLGNILREPRLI